MVLLITIIILMANMEWLLKTATITLRILLHLLYTPSKADFIFCDFGKSISNLARMKNPREETQGLVAGSNPYSCLGGNFTQHTHSIKALHTQQRGNIPSSLRGMWSNFQRVSLFSKLVAILWFSFQILLDPHLLIWVAATFGSSRLHLEMVLSEAGICQGI
jgi:hypothetical protein